MISNKKNYVEQLLHLALTLSLLRVDPESYLDLHWETRLAGTGVGGWQLELRAAPLSDQSYVNRKALPSIIEDLARFDTQYNVPTHFDLQAYLLNIQNSNSTNQTSTTRASSPSPGPAQETPNSTSVVTGEPLLLPTALESFDTEDIFLNSDPFMDSTSVLEQNMADLNDFGEAPINTYALDMIPLKNEPPPMFEDLIRMPFEQNFFERQLQEQLLREEQQQLLQQQQQRRDDQEPSGSSHECCQMCDARKKQAAAVQKVEIKEEPMSGEPTEQLLGTLPYAVEVKQEPEEEIPAAAAVKKEEDDGDESEQKFPVTAELTQEEMDLIEVLWKQDVDLGFSLTPPVGTALGGVGSVKAAGGAADSSDDMEKLKVLLEIKNDDDKKKDDKKEPDEDPWAGLSYTVDTETGEYVLNATDDTEATLPPPLADLFLEQDLNLPELIDDSTEETEEQPTAKKKTTTAEEEEESEVKRIERELETSADELCQGAATAGGSSPVDPTTSISTATGACSSCSNPQSADSNDLNGDTLVQAPATTTTAASEEDEEQQLAGAASSSSSSSASSSGCSSDNPEAAAIATTTDDLEELLCDMMIQTSSSHFQHPRQPMQNYGHGMHGSLRQGGYHHHHHHHHHQSRVPLSRAVSMEQRWQDLANLLSFPPGMGVGMGVGEMPPAHPHAHYPPHYSYQATGAIPQHGQYHSHAAVLQNASLADIGPTQPHYGPNLGSAVATSMHLTNSTSETDAGATGYKMDHEMMYYSNTSSEMNHTDGFLNSILDDDLQLMDIAVNEGMYTMRMLDHNATSSNSSVLGGAMGGAGGGGAAAAAAAAAAAGLSGAPHLGGLMSSAAVAAASVNGAMQTSLNGSTGGVVVTHGGGPNGTTEAAGTTSGDRLDASSDSAVSSMGSERVPSLSDGEWGDGGSDSAQEYHNKYGGPFDYSYSSNSSSRLADGTRQPVVAQKKHHMFAKRYFQEQNTTIPALAPSSSSSAAAGVDHQSQLGAANIPIKYEYDYMTTGSLSHLDGAVGSSAKHEDQSSVHNPLSSVDMKYPYSLDFSRQNPSVGPLVRSHHHDVIHHNHTYTLPHNSGANPKPQTRDKKLRKSEEEHLTRDEKRARALQIPIAVQEIINLPMDEFNERLSKYDLSETQLSLIRDIRRRGKNKVAAQNCRKRKLDQIVSLADEVKEMKMRKERLLHEREVVLAERKKIRDKFSALYRHVFQNLRDGDGNPYSQEHYSLQQSADGSVVLVPRSVERQQDHAGGSHHHQQQQTQQQQQLGLTTAGGSSLQLSHHHHHHLGGSQHSQSQPPHSNGTSSTNANNTAANAHRPRE